MLLVIWNVVVVILFRGLGAIRELARVSWSLFLSRADCSRRLSASCCSLRCLALSCADC